MRSGADRPAAGGAGSRAWRIGAMLMLGAALAGCIAEGPPGVRLASVGGIGVPAGATIAFESVDGPPPQVFQRLVETLAEEAVARKVAVISREAAPQYRIRGYLAAHVDRRSTHIGWVWDVYSADRQRILRISGEEPVTRRVADAWTVADDRMLRRIARTSIERLAIFLDGGPGQTVPPSTGPAVALNDDAPALAAAVALADTRQ
jgi:hypothetical protein